MDATVEALVAAADLTIHVPIVGVGQPDFKFMQMFGISLRVMSSGCRHVVAWRPVTSCSLCLIGALVANQWVAHWQC
jgi:hypothetical protein